MNSLELLSRRNAVVPAAMKLASAIDVDHAMGAQFWDHDGKEYIDFSGGIGVLNAGHCPEPVVQAINNQSKKLLHSFFGLLTHEPYVLLVEKLVKLFPHGESTKGMLLNTGAEAVENAIKIARMATGKQGIICFTGGFHGRTLLGMTLTSKTSYKIGCGPFAPEVYRLPFPDYYHNGKGLSLDAFIDQEITRFRQYLQSVAPPENVAAVIIEPVLGEGGFNVTPVKYMKALRDICTELGMLLILDEVQSGFGRTGKWAAYMHYDIVPDISVWAKSMGAGLPISAVLGKAEIMDKAKPGTLGGTFTGNPVSSAAALATLEYMESININEKGRVIGEKVMAFFTELKKECKSIGDVRGLGAMVAIELVKNQNPDEPDAELTKKLVSACASRGLFLISAGLYSNVIRVLSPLVIEEALLNKGLTILREELLKLTA